MYPKILARSHILNMTIEEGFKKWMKSLKEIKKKLNLTKTAMQNFKPTSHILILYEYKIFNDTLNKRKFYMFEQSYFKNDTPINHICCKPPLRTMILKPHHIFI